MNERLRREDGLLREHFPHFRIQWEPRANYCGVLGMHRTNRGIDYALWIPLGNYPLEAPKMYIVQPKNLKDCNGRLLSDIGTSSQMHLLGPDANGHPQICHYNGKYWTPNVTLYKIVFKGRLWVEAYENHLLTGSPIDLFLGHM